MYFNRINGVEYVCRVERRESMHFPAHNFTFPLSPAHLLTLFEEPFLLETVCDAHERIERK